MAMEITGEDQFKTEVLESGLPVFVDFWAPWCGPCRMVTPVVEEVAEENEDKMKTVKINVDENSDIAGTYGIQSIPALLLFKGGEPVVSILGAVPKAEIEAQIGPHLG